MHDTHHPLALSIVRPLVPGAAPPPYGFICSGLARQLRAIADVSGQTDTTLGASPKHAFVPLVYKGQSAEGRFPADAPTCTRLIVRNPANSLED